MWRKCDLHRHSSPNENDASPLDPGAFIAACRADDLDVIAVTDHDDLSRIQAISDVADGSISVIAGVEVSTDRGHVLILAAVDDALVILGEICERLGVRPDHQVDFRQLVREVSSGSRLAGGQFSDALIAVGAHVDAPSSLLAADQQPGVSSQIETARALAALEVVDRDTLIEWSASGIKQSGYKPALIQSSDHHDANSAARHTWLYLPEVSTRHIRHAFATPESSIRLDPPPPETPFWIQSVSFEGGMHDGIEFVFSRRVNAIIGPPSAGKSLLIDALRLVFDDPCPIPEVHRVTEARTKRHLPAGSIVTVVLISNDSREEIRFVVGSADPPSPPFRPIIFSQTELIRRAMEVTPSMALLDIHCGPAPQIKQNLEGLQLRSVQELRDLLPIADQARQLAEALNNPQDGLAATRASIAELVGDEALAKEMTDLARIEQWRTRIRTSAQAWAENVDVPDGPQIPGTPQLESLPTPDEFIPSAVLRQIAERWPADALAIADDIARALVDALEVAEGAFQERKGETAKLLDVEEEGASDILQRIDSLRARIADLEQKESDLAVIERDIDMRLNVLLGIVKDASDHRTALTAARKSSGTNINSSMRAFFARVNELADPEEIDGLLNGLKTGTNLWTDTVSIVRDTLDRPRLLEFAVRHTQGRPELVGQSDEQENQDRIVIEALDRDKIDPLAMAATTWPDDRLEIAKKPKAGEEPSPFDELTEGMRALAIKEISFAASDLPVISDQPEDSVPTTAVFETLVPTLREQRINRQFIVVSDDANVVVTGDAEQIIVIDPESTENPISGSLFDGVIRGHALSLLEGGDVAFRQRQERYGEGTS